MTERARVEGTDVKPVKRVIKHIALKNLCTSKGQVKKGEKFTCTSEEAEKFKKVKAI